MTRAVVAACGLDAASFAFLALAVPAPMWAYESNLFVVSLAARIGVAGIIAVKIGLALLLAVTARYAARQRALCLLVYAAVGVTLLGAGSNISLIVQLAALR